MKSKSTNLARRAGHLTFLGIGLGALYWILESALDAFVFDRGNLVEVVLTSHPHEMWMRSLFVCILVVFGVYAQVIVSKRKRAEERQKQATQVLELLNQSGGKTDGIRDILLFIKELTALEAVGIRLREGEDFPYYETSGFPATFVENEKVGIHLTQVTPISCGFPFLLPPTKSL